MKYPPRPVDLSKYLYANKLTPTAVANLLGYNPRTVRYWLDGKNNMPYTAWFTLRTLVEGEAPETLV